MLLKLKEIKDKAVLKIKAWGVKIKAMFYSLWHGNPPTPPAPPSV